MLAALKLTGGEVAERIGVPRQMVHAWRTGQKVPSPEMRAALEREVSIPSAAWERAPVDRPAPTQALAARAASGPAREGMTTHEDVTRLLEDLARDAATDGILLSDLVRIRGERVKALSLKARIERDLALQEEAILGGPVWIGMRERIVAALRPFPDAARAVAEALREMGAA